MGAQDHRAWPGAIFVAGFLLAFLPLALFPTISHPDEIYQSMEAGHRLAFGYGVVPWEFDYGARSWALGYLTAGPMRLAAALGGGPRLYLSLIWALLSLLSAATTLCAFLWGRRAYGAAAGAAVALVAASWVDNLYFGGRATSEAISAHLLILAAFLAEPGYKVERGWRFVLSGFLTGLAIMLRIQLLPAALVLWLWGGWDRRRLALFGIAALAAVALDGWFDAVTWHQPFEPLWRTIQFNLLQNGAVYFGKSSFLGYFPLMGDAWGGGLALFLPLALLGARRMKLLAAMALLIFLVHGLIGHKEYRFILAFAMMAAILAGFGLVELARLISHGLRDRGVGKAGLAVAWCLGLCWSVLAITLLLDRAAKQMDQYRLLQATLHLSNEKSVCGVGFADWLPANLGGYTFLHRPVPVYAGYGVHGDGFVADRPAYNALVRDTTRSRFEAPSLFGAYKKERCWNKVCIFIRPGTCTARRYPPPAITAMSSAVIAHYPYSGGLP